MPAHRWFTLFSAIAGLIAMVAWIGEIDLGMEDSLAPLSDHPAKPSGSTSQTPQP